MVSPDSAASFWKAVARHITTQIDSGRWPAETWEIDGPVWTKEMSRVTYYTHALTRDAEVEFRYLTKSSAGYANHQVLVRRGNAVLVEAAAEDAKPLVEAVCAHLAPAVAAWRADVERDLG